MKSGVFTGVFHLLVKRDKRYYLKQKHKNLNM